jgi:DinB superfamily
MQTFTETVLSEQERAQAVNCLAQSRDQLLEAVAGLTDAQWRFKPSSTEWSIAEIVEHLALIENRVHGIIASMPESPAPDAGHDCAAVERMIVTEIPVRGRKVQAPPIVSPQQLCTPDEALEQFLASRAQTPLLLETAAALRGHVRAHPLFGPWDGYQWILAAGAHTARHTAQILEVKSCAGFPAAFA